jgi:hypothetical protein
MALLSEMPDLEGRVRFSYVYLALLMEAAAVGSLQGIT